MLLHTFCHLAGVGPVLEQRLWRVGFATWHEYLNGIAPPPKAYPHTRGQEEVRESLSRREQGDLAYFAARLPARERWRLFFDGRPRSAFLDIETTGLGIYADITTVAIYDGRQLRTFVAGQNLEDVPAALEEYALLITYNGASFDLPVLERFFGIRLLQAHIDLRYVLASLGLKGGLKGVERRMGMARPGMEAIDGFVAVLLWREYERSGDPAALRTLLAYNAQDALNLERLMVEAHNRMVAQTPFDHLVLPVPPEFENPFEPCPQALARLRQPTSPPLYRSH